MRDNLVNLRLADPRALDAQRLRSAGRKVESIALTDQLLSTRLVENRARVSQGRGSKRQTRGNIRLNQAGHNVNRRTLRRQHQVDASGTRQLSDALNRGFNIARSDHHHVGELINHNQQIRVRVKRALQAGLCLNLTRRYSLIEIVNVLEAILS
ncbi:Uncharacterised protein [Chlamydia trachomatis]|nr:Uncharacterised protein [Chlamydia trachomatis]